MCAKIAKISGGKGELTQDGAIGVGHQPTQANAGGRCGGGEQAAGPAEVYGLIVDRGEAARTAAVVLSLIDYLYARRRVAHGEIALGTRRETIRWRRRQEDIIYIKVPES